MQIVHRLLMPRQTSPLRMERQALDAIALGLELRQHIVVLKSAWSNAAGLMRHSSGRSAELLQPSCLKPFSQSFIQPLSPSTLTVTDTYASAMLLAGAAGGEISKRPSFFLSWIRSTSWLKLSVFSTVSALSKQLAVLTYSFVCLSLAARPRLSAKPACWSCGSKEMKRKLLSVPLVRLPLFMSLATMLYQRDKSFDASNRLDQAECACVVKMSQQYVLCTHVNSSLSSSLPSTGLGFHYLCLCYLCV